MLNAKIAYFFHPVHDLKESLHFFKDIMGFSLVYSNFTDLTPEQVVTEEIAKLQWLEFDGGNITLLVQQVPGIQPYETGIGFQVNNCDEAFVFFKNNGVEITRGIQGGYGKLRTFEIKDPTGSVFTIFGE